MPSLMAQHSTTNTKFVIKRNSLWKQVFAIRPSFARFGLEITANAPNSRNQFSGVATKFGHFPFLFSLMHSRRMVHFISEIEELKCKTASEIENEIEIHEFENETKEFVNGIVEGLSKAKLKKRLI